MMVTTFDEKQCMFWTLSDVSICQILSLLLISVMVFTFCYVPSTSADNDVLAGGLALIGERC